MRLHQREHQADGQVLPGLASISLSRRTALARRTSNAIAELCNPSTIPLLLLFSGSHPALLIIIQIHVFSACTHNVFYVD